MTTQMSSGAPASFHRVGISRIGGIEYDLM